MSSPFLFGAFQRGWQMLPSKTLKGQFGWKKNILAKIRFYSKIK
jgi:hypothetical protein